MLDYFAIMGLPRRAALSAETVRASFQEKGSHLHPDKAATPGERERLAGEFSILNEAQAVLSSPSRRLQHLAELLSGEKQRGGVLPESVMGLFGRLSSALQAADALIAKREQAHTSLAKAVMAADTLREQESLEALSGEIRQQSDQALAGLQEVDTALEQQTASVVADLHSSAQVLAFLQRWEGQIQSRRLRLID